MDDGMIQSHFSDMVDLLFNAAMALARLAAREKSNLS